MLKREPNPAIEADFLSATERLVNNCPEHELLKKEVERKGAVRLTIKSVALEAGHSRTLLARSNSKYNSTRKKVLDRISRKKEPKYDLTTELRSTIKDLTEKLRLAQSETLHHFNARIDAEKEAERWRNAYRAEHDNRIQGRKVESITRRKAPK